MKNILKIIVSLTVVLAILLVALYFNIAKEKKANQTEVNEKNQVDIIKDIPCDGPPDVCLRDKTVTNTNDFQDKVDGTVINTNDFQDEVKVDLGDIKCTPEQREVDACDEIYKPVCATVNIQCITTPCDPIKGTYENSCKACINSLVSSYIEGECGN